MTLDEDEQRAWLLEQLRAAVVRLASSPQNQIDYLRGLAVDVGDCADELALELADCKGAAIGRAGLLAPQQIAAVEHLDAQLGEMSGSEHAELWTFDALEAAHEWDEVRQRARAAAGLLRSTA